MPTVILNPLKSSDLYNNEVFGPIMKVNTFRNIDEVINEINEREKPLVIYYFGRIGRLWSKTNENKEKLRNRTSSGMFVVNDVAIQIMNGYLPFGGVGNSGTGAFKGQVGFKHFSH